MNPADGFFGREKKPGSVNHARATRLWQLGQSSMLSPSMMTSTGPPSDSSTAYAPSDRTDLMHHSVSTPQLLPAPLGGNYEASSTRYRSGPSALLGSSEVQANGHLPTKAALNDPRPRIKPKVPFQDEPSPNGFIENSSIEAGSPLQTRAYQRKDIGTGSIENAVDVPYEASDPGPWSAPAYMKTFAQRARDENVRMWNKDSTDDRWVQGPEELYVATMFEE
ncbi:MAG: hypothetical protein Q9220_000079 [cf. Caloplaca sp. 1 TL-2023]